MAGLVRRNQGHLCLVIVGPVLRRQGQGAALALVRRREGRAGVCRAHLFEPDDSVIFAAVSAGCDEIQIAITVHVGRSERVIHSTYAPRNVMACPLRRRMSGVLEPHDPAYRRRRCHFGLVIVARRAGIAAFQDIEP